MALNLDDKKRWCRGQQGRGDGTVRGCGRVPWSDGRQMTDLRSKARAQGVYMRVVKNTLARKAVAGTAFENIGPILKGPLVLAFSKDDPGAAARVLKAFAKDHDKLIATAVSLGGQLLPGKDLDKVAALPTRDQALAQLMA